jgi:hypothetical protein
VARGRKLSGIARWRLWLTGTVIVLAVLVVLSNNDHTTTFTICSESTKTAQGKEWLELDTSEGNFVARASDLKAKLKDKVGHPFDVTYDGLLEKVISVADPAADPSKASSCTAKK